jgi:hypothetical protein
LTERYTLLYPFLARLFTYVSDDGENLELNMIGENVRPLRRSVFLTHYLVLNVESLLLQKYGLPSESAIPFAKNILPDSGSDSTYQMAMM